MDLQAYSTNSVDIQAYHIGCLNLHDSSNSCVVLQAYFTSYCLCGPSGLFILPAVSTLRLILPTMWSFRLILNSIKAFSVYMCLYTFTYMNCVWLVFFCFFVFLYICIMYICICIFWLIFLHTCHFYCDRMVLFVADHIKPPRIHRQTPHPHQYLLSLPGCTIWHFIPES